MTQISLLAFSRARVSRRRQHGVVLFIALIVMVALSLAAIALIRSVDTTNAVVGNLSFRMASILPGNLAVELAAAALFPDADIASAVHIANKNADLPAENYFASWQNSDDARGVPLVLQKKSTAYALAKKGSDPSTKTDMTYVIERMCQQPGPPVNAPPSSCDLLLPKVPLGTTVGDTQINLPPDPYYRVTIRVDGPQNTASFLQAMLK
jgi:type IV pilus assembly protein PilX